MRNNYYQRVYNSWHFEAPRNSSPRQQSQAPDSLIRKLARMFVPLRFRLILRSFVIDKVFRIEPIVVERKEIDVAFVSYPQDPIILKKRNHELVTVMQGYFSELGLPRRACHLLHEDICKYDAIFRAWPHKDLRGGTGYNNGLLLFCFTRAVQPDVFLESGVYRGMSTYFLDGATKESTALACFDLKPELKLFQSPKATYYDQDISDADLKYTGATTLAFFDDHQPQYDRLLYASENQIRYLAFDDDVPALLCHADGWPPIPTVAMVWNEKAPTAFSWVCDNRIGHAHYQCDLRERLIDEYHYKTVPELFEITGYRHGSRMSFLSKKNT